MKLKVKVKHQLSDRPINPADYINLVKFIANKYIVKCPSNIELGDLYSAGTIGLIDAIGKFDSSKENKFTTYASHRILGAMKDEVRKIRGIPRYASGLKFVPFDNFQVANNAHDDMVSRLENIEFLRKNCNNITKREMKLLKFYFFCDLSCSEIGKKLGVTDVRIWQILKRTLAKIRGKHDYTARIEAKRDE
jgi:RNA polymerase sigma factor (sigma-70 family)